MREYQIVHLHPAAPAKPASGATCNGCGVCCAAAPCPLAMLLFRRRRDIPDAACPALRWQTDGRRYACGLLVAPGDYLRWLPRWLVPLAQRACFRWIAAGSGCDSIAEVQ